MTPQRKLAIANAVMVIGVAPLALACAFDGVNFATGWTHKPDREAVALTMVLLTTGAWGWALFTALPACIVSFLLARRERSLTGGRILRRVVVVLLLLPPIGMSLYPASDGSPPPLIRTQ